MDNSIWKASLLGYGTGLVFGFVMEKSKVYLPTIIRSQMRMESFTMLKMFLTAMSTSTLVVAILTQLGIITRKPRHPISIGTPSTSFLKRYNGNIIGGALLGIGMTLSGACPGTVYVQLGSGLRSSFYIFGGALAGSLLYSVYDHYNTANQHTHLTHDKSPPTIDQLFNMNQMNTSLLVGGAVAAILYSVEMLAPWKSDLLHQVPWISSSTLLSSTTLVKLVTASAWPPILAGVIVGLLQLPSLLSMRSQLGTSSSFVCMVSHLATLVDSQALQKLPYLSRFRTSLDYWQLFLAAGMVSGSWLSIQLMSDSSRFVTMLNETTNSQIPKSILALGGMLLLFGARMAGGCTSGHGLSGFSQLSVASAVSVASMFGGGMVTAWLLPIL